MTSYSWVLWGIGIAAGILFVFDVIGFVAYTVSTFTVVLSLVHIAIIKAHDGQRR